MRPSSKRDFAEFKGPPKLFNTWITPDFLVTTLEKTDLNFLHEVLFLQNGVLMALKHLIVSPTWRTIDFLCLSMFFSNIILSSACALSILTTITPRANRKTSRYERRDGVALPEDSLQQLAINSYDFLIKNTDNSVNRVKLQRSSNVFLSKNTENSVNRVKLQ